MVEQHMSTELLAKRVQPEHKLPSLHPHPNSEAYASDDAQISFLAAAAIGFGEI
jgi:hypothetical protein